MYRLLPVLLLLAVGPLCADAQLSRQEALRVQQEVFSAISQADTAQIFGMMESPWKLPDAQALVAELGQWPELSDLKNYTLQQISDAYRKKGQVRFKEATRACRTHVWTQVGEPQISWSARGFLNRADSAKTLGSSAVTLICVYPAVPETNNAALGTASTDRMVLRLDMLQFNGKLYLVDFWLRPEDANPTAGN